MGSPPKPQAGAATATPSSNSDQANQRDKIDPRIFRYRPDQIVDGDGAYWIAGIYALLGERKPALDWLRRAITLGDGNYPWFQRDRNFDRLRTDPEYQAIMTEVRQRWEGYAKEFGSSQ